MGTRSIAVAVAALFLLLVACAGEKAIVLPEHIAVPAIAPEVPVEEPMTVVDTSAQDLMVVEGDARALVKGWQDWNASEMYPVLSLALQGRVNATQLQSLMDYFPPKDRTFVLLKKVEAFGPAYRATIYRGSDYLGWETHDVPFAFEKDGWHAVLFDDLTTVDGIVGKCKAKTGQQPDDTPEVAQGKAHAASSCLFNAAVVLRNASLCGHALYDQERCFGRLGVELDRDAWIMVCGSGAYDATSRSQCLWKTAVRLADVEMCRSIPTNRTERYMCLGEVGALVHEPWQCNDAMNDYLLKLCAKSYADEAESHLDLCKNDATARFYNC